MLIISRYCAYDSAAYAGSKTHNYYLKRLYKDYDVKVLTVANSDDLPKLDFKKYGIDADVVVVDEDPRRAWFFLFHNWRNIPNYFGKTMGLVNGYVRRCLVKRARELLRQGYRPDIVLLEWTQTLLMIKDMKKIFPSALYIASEHDVSFLRYQRRYASASGPGKIKEYLRYASEKKIEMASLREADLIVPHNSKDGDLLISAGIAPRKVHPIAPFYNDYGDVRYDPTGRGVLFFGAMDREDNYASAVWFIEKVFLPRLACGYTLAVVGNRPHPSLDKYKSERILVTGFVPDIRPYLRQSVCKVAPLLSGAGIKVKVIEAMSAGLPVLANAIAMEGIPAVNGTHYFHCETPGEYAAVFERIDARHIDLLTISKNAKKLVSDTFNLEKSYSAYKQAIDDTYTASRVCGRVH